MVATRLHYRIESAVYGNPNCNFRSYHMGRSKIKVRELFDFVQICLTLPGMYCAESVHGLGQGYVNV